MWILRAPSPACRGPVRGLQNACSDVIRPRDPSCSSEASDMQQNLSGWKQRDYGAILVRVCDSGNRASSREPRTKECPLGRDTSEPALTPPNLDRDGGLCIQCRCAPCMSCAHLCMHLAPLCASLPSRGPGWETEECRKQDVSAGPEPALAWGLWDPSQCLVLGGTGAALYEQALTRSTTVSPAAALAEEARDQSWAGVGAQGCAFPKTLALSPCRPVQWGRCLSHISGGPVTSSVTFGKLLPLLSVPCGGDSIAKTLGAE